MRAGYFSTTTKHSATTEADSFTVEGAAAARKAYYVVADATVYLRRDGGDASADSGLRLPANVPILVCCFVGDVVSYVAESTANVWFTECDHA